MRYASALPTASPSPTSSAADPSARVVMCSALGQESKVVEALKLGAKDFVVTPFRADRVVGP